MMTSFQESYAHLADQSTCGRDGGNRTQAFLCATAARASELLLCGELATLEDLDHGAPHAAPDILAQRIVGRRRKWVLVKIVRDSTRPDPNLAEPSLGRAKT